jgi:hypothetical protein
VHAKEKSWRDLAAQYHNTIHQMEKREREEFVIWQNRLNYSGSIVLVIAIQAILTQRTSDGTIQTVLPQLVSEL